LSVEIPVVEIEDAEDAEFEEEVEQLLFFPPLVDVPRDFFVGGSSRVPPFIEFRLPWDGLLLFSLLERLLDAFVVDNDWPERVGELFTGALRRRPIVVALAILCVCLRVATGILFTVILPAHRH